MANSDLAKLVVKLEAQTAQYVSELDKAQKKLSKFTQDQDVTLKGVGKTFLALGAAAAVGLAAMTKNAIDGADHLNDLSKATGVSVEELSKISFAAKQSGADLESITTGFRKLNLAIAEAAGKGTSDSAVAFKALGISITDTSGRLKSADEVFREVADKFKGFSDGANKSQIANQLFGKSFQELIPLLNEGSENIKAMGDRAAELGLVIGTDTARAADEFNDRLGEMKAQLIDGLGNQIAANVLPAFNELAKIWQEDSGRAETLSAIAGTIATTLKVLVTLGIAITSVFQQVGQVIYSTGAAFLALQKGDVRGALDEITSGFDTLGDNVSKDIEKVKRIWDTSPLNPAEMDKATASAKDFYAAHKGHGAIKAVVEAPNLTGLLEAQKAAEEAAKKHAAAIEQARQKLTDLNVDLGEQVKTFGLGDAAATKYRLTIGNLADDVQLTGAAGGKLRESIIQQATALEQLANAKKLSDMRDELQEEVKTFGLGEAAATEYRLTVGSMAKDVAAAGAAGGALRDSIVQQANALERLQNVQALNQVDQDIQNLTGHTKEATLAAFDLANALLKASLQREGDTEGLAKLEKLRALTAAQAEFNEMQQKQRDILDDLAAAEDRIQHSQEVGAINELGALSQLSTARAEAADQLQKIAESQAKIAEGAGNPELTRGAEEAARAVAKLRDETHLLEDRIKTTFEDAGSDAFAEFLKGAKTAQEAVTSFIQAIESEVANFVAKDLFRRLFGELGSGTGGGGGGGGGWLGAAANFVAGLFGGTRDSGGRGEKGRIYKIGRGAQPEHFMPDTNGTFVPASAMAGGGMTVNNYFNISAPGGMVDRRTEQQVAAAAGRGVANAQRRNG